MTTFEHQILTILTTGGTIEKIYDETEGLLENRGPVIRDKIKSRLRLPYTEFQVRSLMSKDSLHMTLEDRNLIVQEIIIELNQLHPVVILHGTDTMVETAQLAMRLIKNPQAPVVFTGAMKPFGFEDSDAIQNITEAIISVRLLTPGIYISFHSAIYPANCVQKLKQKNTFGPLVP